MDNLINAIDAFAIELRNEQVNYSVCDTLRLNIDRLADCNRQEINDLLLYRKIKEIGYIYHNTNIENVQKRYNLVGMCYYCIDKLQRLNNN